MHSHFDYRRILLLFAAAITFGLTSCSSVAPLYQPTNDNVKLLQSDRNSKLTTGDFKNGGKHGDELNRLTIRGGSFISPYQGSYALYIKEAIHVELEAADRWDPKANVRVSGELLDNWLDGSGTSVGNARITARFVVVRAGVKTYDKTLTAQHEWESSFSGSIAGPRARQSYIETIHMLINKLFSDKEFQLAVKKL